VPDGPVPWAGAAPAGGPPDWTTSRRAVLAVLGSILVAGCRPSRRPPVAAAGPPVRDAAALDSARADEQALLSLYDATLAVHAALSPQLGPVREHHQRHLDALPPDQARPMSGASTGAVPTGGNAPSGPAPVVPADPLAAVRALVDAENAAARGRAADCLGAARGLAGLLASIAASEAAHAVALARR